MSLQGREMQIKFRQGGVVVQGLLFWNGIL